MPSASTVTFSDEITAWLCGKADTMNVDVAALVAMIVDDVAEQTTTTPAWQEHDLLEIWRHLALRPGRAVTLQTLRADWREVGLIRALGGGWDVRSLPPREGLVAARLPIDTGPALRREE